jgi:hypothetical protein
MNRRAAHFFERASEFWLEKDNQREDSHLKDILKQKTERVHLQVFAEKICGGKKEYSD